MAWSSELTAHGLPLIIRKKNCYAKIIWMLFTALAVGLCCYMVVKTITEYLKYEVVTKIRKEIRFHVKFPIVSICNTNPFVTQAASDYIKESIRRKYNISLLNSEQLIEAVSNNQIDFFYLDWLYYQTFDKNFNETLKKSFGYDVESFILKAYLNGISLNHFDDFEWYYNFFYGNCFKFNSKGENPQFFIDDCLEIELFSGLPYDIKSNYYLATNYGFTIFIDDQDIFLLLSLGIFIRTGTFTNIGFRRVESESLLSQYSNCVEAEMVDTIISREMKLLDIKYSRKNCLDLMAIKMAMEHVECYDIKYPQILNATPCNTFETYLSLMNMTYPFDDYLDMCPFECKTVSLELSFSFNSFPTFNHYKLELYRDREMYEKLFETNNISIEHFQLIIARIYVKVDDIRVTHISESPTMNIPDLSANLGGTLGLFIGVSILSFVEIIELIVDLIFIFAKYLKRKK